MIDRYLVDTPEQIDVAYDVAGIGSRFLAAIVDTLIILVIEGVLLFVLSLVASQLVIADSIATAIAVVLSFVVLWGYYLVAEMLSNGQSPGKRLVGVRVVREGGRPVTFTASAIRNIIRLVDFLPLFYSIGVVVMFVDRRARRLGDLAAGTLVVRERAPVTLESLSQSGYVELPAGEVPEMGHIDRLTDDDYVLLQEFLRRRAELSNEARGRIGAQLAEGLRVRLDAAPPGPIEPFLIAVASAYAAYRRRPPQSAAEPPAD
jgi:uncharacterized RDD family membrane protein YckC